MRPTYKEACELIARYFNELELEDKKLPGNKESPIWTGKDVFNYSPTGELFMIPVWYEEAVEYFASKEINHG